MKLVKFEDGSYGVRCHWFFGWYFRDLASIRALTWRKGDRWFRDCKGSLEDAKRVMGEPNIKYMRLQSRKGA